MKKRSSPPALLDIHDLHVTVDGKQAVRGFSLRILPGEVHAIMGPNGSGKSTLVSALMGHPKYTVTKGSVTLSGENLLTMPPDERARRGLFLAFQYPKEIAGVTLRSFLMAAYDAQMKQRDPAYKKISPITFAKLLQAKAKALHMDPSLIERPVNKGFSGGEKKKAEILQLNLLHPAVALLDETDSGLDVDALRSVSEGVNAMRSPEFAVLLVTHYARILEYIVPDRVHVMVKGRIVKSGGAAFAKQLEKEGYGAYGGGEQSSLSLSLDVE
jgi:Fe-S cluster assembly ATP-binding protein